MNKIILISCVLSLALSTAAPLYGYIGCQNDQKAFCSDKGTCNGVSGLCKCTSPNAGFNCAQTAELTAQPNDFAKCKGEIALAGKEVDAACKTALSAAVVALNWKTSTFTAFTNFAITFQAGRTEAFTFTSDFLKNALDNIEFQYIYSVYDNRAATPVTSFSVDTNKAFAVSYIAAIQNMVQAYTIANTFQAGGYNLVSDEAQKNTKAFTTTVGTWGSAIYAVDAGTQDTKLGVASVTVSPVVNTISAGYGNTWGNKLSMVGYMQVFKSWGNPAVVVKAGSLYSALLLVFKVVQADGGDAKKNTITVAVAGDFTTATKTQSLVFTDDKIDTTYKWATSTILFAAGETAATACTVAKVCTATATVATGSQIVYVYTESLSNYLISFSLILSALTLSL